MYNPVILTSSCYNEAVICIITTVILEIRSQELAKVMAPYGIEIGNSIDEVFVRVDTDASGSIGYDEFKAFMPVRQPHLISTS